MDLTEEYSRSTIAGRRKFYPFSQRVSFHTASAMTDVFISYKREERDKIVLIADRLRALGLDVWFDARLTTGHHFDREIDQHVRKAGCVLVCWSEGALSSEWVRAEAAIGRERNVLVPLMVEACSPPVPFNTLQTENLIGWAGEADHDGWLRAVDQIAGLVQRPELGQEQRARGQNERDLRRTQALLEAQKREEEDAQRRAATAASKRVVLEAQLASMGASVPPAVHLPLAQATAARAPRAGLAAIIGAYAFLIVALLALAWTTLFAVLINPIGTGFAFAGAALGAVVGAWLNRTDRPAGVSLKSMISVGVLVLFTQCATIGVLMQDEFGRDFGPRDWATLLVVAFIISAFLQLVAPRLSTRAREVAAWRRWGFGFVVVLIAGVALLPLADGQGAHRWGYNTESAPSEEYTTESAPSEEYGTEPAPSEAYLTEPTTTDPYQGVAPTTTQAPPATTTP